jgi:hypothetical protein
MTGNEFIAEAVGQISSGSYGRGALIDGDIFKVRILWRCCRSFLQFQRIVNAGTWPTAAKLG